MIQKVIFVIFTPLCTDVKTLHRGWILRVGRQGLSLKFFGVQRCFSIGWGILIFPSYIFEQGNDEQTKLKADLHYPCSR